MKPFVSLERGEAPEQLDPARVLARAAMLAAGLIGGLAAFLVGVALGGVLFGTTNVAWYLSRSSAMVAFVLLWASMALGVGISNKMARIWPGAFTAFDLHQYTGLLGSAFVGVHMLALLGDTYIGYNLVQILVPFASTAYEPLWVGIGQIALYVLIPVTLSFYARKRLGTRAWRTIHGLGYGFFALSLLHGLFSGTDSHNGWALAIYGFSTLSLVALTAYRLLAVYLRPAKKAAPLATSR